MKSRTYSSLARGSTLLTFRIMYTLFTLPLYILYYVYIKLPLFIIHTVLIFFFTQFMLLFEVCRRRSSLFRQFIRQFAALLDTTIRILKSMKQKPSHSLQWVIITIVEVIITYICSLHSIFRQEGDLSRQLSFELISYEEDN
jgi:hypothetical protein